MRLIVDPQGLFGVNDGGIDIVLHLVDRLHGTRRALTRLRDGPHLEQDRAFRARSGGGPAWQKAGSR